MGSAVGGVASAPAFAPFFLKLRFGYHSAKPHCPRVTRTMSPIRLKFVRIHKTLRVAPAMAAGVIDRLWEIGDTADLVDAAEPAPKSRGPYKKRDARISN